jgi:hypothetical protein
VRAGAMLSDGCCRAAGCAAESRAHLRVRARCLCLLAMYGVPARWRSEAKRRCPALARGQLRSAAGARDMRRRAGRCDAPGCAR